MIPVDQTVFGYPHGDCKRACVASIFELPIEDVPNWSENESDELMWDAFLNWVWRNLSHKVLVIRGEGVKENKVVIDGWGTPHVILGGKSPRGDFHHACVGRVNRGKGMVIVHDPHPRRGGLETIEDVTLFVPYRSV